MATNHNGPRVSEPKIRAALALIELDFTEEERALMVEQLTRRQADYRALRSVPFENHEAPAIRFDAELAPAMPMPPGDTADEAAAQRLGAIRRQPPRAMPEELGDLAYWSIADQARLLYARKLKAVELTELYLARLQRYGEPLECVVTQTDEHALAQARAADLELDRGQWRGPLHGIPWGAKDLLATKDIPTTWGAPPFRDQIIDQDATVVQRLNEAGAVLAAKLTMGSLAWGDVWFGGRTRSPWNLEEGSSGSSAGSGAATAAGLVGFSIGSETYGSIVSPSNQCGTTGLRPTFGRVSRHGAMTLCWTLDKIGPMCRSAEDCALVFGAIHGVDTLDPTTVQKPFAWPGARVKGLRVGVVEADFEEAGEFARQNGAALGTLEELGMELTPVQLPEFPLESMQMILWAEAAAAFDDLTRSDRDELLVRQGKDSWPNRFRAARLIPAVEYLQAQRLRRKVMVAMQAIFEEVDLLVAPAVYGQNLWLTNATGHPAVVFPHGFRPNGLPTTLTLTGRLFDEATILGVAQAFQSVTDFHTRRPPNFL